MSVGAISSQSAILLQSLLGMRSQMDDLSRQLSTGQKSTTYQGLGLDRGLSVGLRTQLSQIDSYDGTMTLIGTRLAVAQTTLQHLSTMGDQVKSAVVTSSYDPDANGQTTPQKIATSNLTEYLSLLNTKVGDHYLFSGRSSGTPPTDTVDHILNGNGNQAGLKQLISERNQADLGANGLGRLVITAPGPGIMQLNEDVAGSPFGFKLAAITSDITGATVNGPALSPPAVGIDLTSATPTDGQKVNFKLNLPDGSSETLTLTATTTSPPGANQFLIGATPAQTATNLQTALNTSLGTLAQGALAAASAMAASNDFFTIDANNPPQRVNGPPFNSATSLVPGTSSNTVSWYQGDDATDNPRTTAGAQIDPALTVGYGMRANEQGIRYVLQNIAVLAASTFPPSDPNGSLRASALRSRLIPALDVPDGTQHIQDIETDLAGVQTQIKDTQDRHKQTSATLNDLLENIEGVSNEQVGMQLMTLQTRLQASMQTTSMLYQMSLVNYVK